MPKLGDIPKILRSGQPVSKIMRGGATLWLPAGSGNARVRDDFNTKDENNWNGYMATEFTVQDGNLSALASGNYAQLFRPFPINLNDGPLVAGVLAVPNSNASNSTLGKIGLSDAMDRNGWSFGWAANGSFVETKVAGAVTGVYGQPYPIETNTWQIILVGSEVRFQLSSNNGASWTTYITRPSNEFPIDLLYPVIGAGNYTAEVDPGSLRLSYLEHSAYKKENYSTLGRVAYSRSADGNALATTQARMLITAPVPRGSLLVGYLTGGGAPAVDGYYIDTKGNRHFVRLAQRGNTYAYGFTWCITTYDLVAGDYFDFPHAASGGFTNRMLGAHAFRGLGIPDQKLIKFGSESSSSAISRTVVMNNVLYPGKAGSVAFSAMSDRSNSQSRRYIEGGTAGAQEIEWANSSGSPFGDGNNNQSFFVRILQASGVVDTTTRTIARTGGSAGTQISLNGGGFGLNFPLHKPETYA